MGTRDHLRRTEDAPGPQTRQQAGPVEERDASGSDPGTICVIDRSFRDPIADVRVRRDDGARPGSAVILWMLPDPEMPTAGMLRRVPREVPAVVRRRALGDAAGTNGAATQPNQSASHQASAIEVEDEATRAQAPASHEEDLYGDCGYGSLNGIASHPCQLGRINSRMQGNQN